MVTVLGNVFHSFGALYKQQLSHIRLDNVSSACNVVDNFSVVKVYRPHVLYNYITKGLSLITSECMNIKSLKNRPEFYY